MINQESIQDSILGILAVNARWNRAKTVRDRWIGVIAILFISGTGFNAYMVLVNDRPDGWSLVLMLLLSVYPLAMAVKRGRQVVDLDDDMVKRSDALREIGRLEKCNGSSPPVYRAYTVTGHGLANRSHIGNVELDDESVRQFVAIMKRYDRQSNLEQVF